jgi:hypothetical protein
MDFFRDAACQHFSVLIEIRLGLAWAPYQQQSGKNEYTDRQNGKRDQQVVDI